MMRRIIHLLIAGVLCCTMQSNVFAKIIYIGNNDFAPNKAGSQTVPYSFHCGPNGWGERHNYAIYTASEIASTGMIESIAYEVTKSHAVTAGIKIYMGTTSLSCFSDMSQKPNLDELTKVYDGTRTFGSSLGWETVQLTIPYCYDHSKGNLIIAVVNNSNVKTDDHLCYAASKFARSSQVTDIFWFGDHGTMENSHRPDIGITINGSVMHTCSSNPTWQWDGTSSACAKYTCSVCKASVTSASISATQNTTAASCETDGKVVYTVKFGNYSDQKTQIKPMLGHTYSLSSSQPIWTWRTDASGEYTSASVKLTCKTCLKQSDFSASISRSGAATCTQSGTCTYTAKFGSFTDTKSKTVSKLGHNYISHYGAQMCSRCGDTDLTCESFSGAWYMGNNTCDAPFYMWGNYSSSQCIYSRDMIGTAGTIKKIAYYVNKASAFSPSVKIYMGHTTISSFNISTDSGGNSYATNPISTTGLTCVFNGTWSNLAAQTGWNELTLTNPFVYNGTDNLVVVVDEYDSAGSTRHNNVYFASVIDHGKTMSIQKCGNSSYYYSTSTSTRYDKDGLLPATRFTIQRKLETEQPLADSQGYYLIDNAKKLNWFSQQVFLGNTSLNAKLTADITVNTSVLNANLRSNTSIISAKGALPWVPIGSANGQNEYAGTFDGGNHFISGLYCNQPNIDNISLIAQNAGTIVNLTIKDSYLCGNIVGAFAGMNRGKIGKCENRSYIESAQFGGGICGRTEGEANIQHCTNSGSIVSREYAGGIVGHFSGQGEGSNSITACFNEGTIKGSSFAGGIAGVCDYGTIRNSFNRGAVSSDQKAAGITPYMNAENYPVKASFCLNCGSVSGSTTSAMFGDIFNAQLNSCYYEEGVCSNPSDVNTSGINKCVASRLSSGEIAYLLNGSSCDYSSTNTEVFWYQTIGSDQTPVLDATHDEVHRQLSYCCKNGKKLIETKYGNTDEQTYKNSMTMHTAVAPTCVTSGNCIYYTCKTCNSMYLDANGTRSTDAANTKIAALGHKYEQGKCTVCGEDDPVPVFADGYYQIATVANLFWFASQVNEGNTAIKGMLTADITVNSITVSSAGTVSGTASKAWTPISNFSGVFDGQGHTIRGLYCNLSSKNDVGMFAQNKGTIMNLSIADSYFRGLDYVGSIAGQSTGRIGNCHNSSYVQASYKAGGICGKATNDIQKCTNIGNVVSSINNGSYVGGIVAVFSGGYIMNACFNSGNVTGCAYAGGIAGMCDDGTINNCLNVGTVTSNDGCAAGIVGSMNAATPDLYYPVCANYCLNCGIVDGVETDAMFGNLFNVDINKCYYKEGDIRGVYGTSVSIAELSNGSITYMLNDKSSDYSLSSTELYWYQNLDNGKTVDGTPCLDDTHGGVYAMPALGYYTNTTIIPATSITLAAVQTAVGQTSAMTVTVLPSNATVNTSAFRAKGYKAINWTSNNTPVASVLDGMVTAKDKGTATITAQLRDGSGKTGSAIATVYLLGDANGNGKVNIADVTTIAAKLNNITPDKFVFAPANANFTNNTTLNSADIASVISIINSGATYNAAAGRNMSNESQPTLLYADPISIIPGQMTEINIMVQNASETFSAFDFKMRLPEGLSFVADEEGIADANLCIDRTSVANTNAFSARVREDGSLYVLCYSTENNQFEGQSGRVASIRVQADNMMLAGTYYLDLSDIVLSAYGEEIRVDDQTSIIEVQYATGIQSLSGSASQVRIYDLNGHLVRGNGSLDELPAGIYIVNGQKVVK